MGLSLGPNKTAAPGYLYSAVYVAEKAKYIYYIDAEGLRGGLARLGGEGRMAVVEIEEASAGVPEVINGRALVLTPVLMPEGELPNCIKPLGVLEERGGGLELVPKVRVIQWGLGFSEVCKERRPMYYVGVPSAKGIRVLRAEAFDPSLAREADSWLGSLADSSGVPVPISAADRLARRLNAAAVKLLYSASPVEPTYRGLEAVLAAVREL